MRGQIFAGRPAGDGQFDNHVTRTLSRPATRLFCAVAICAAGVFAPFHQAMADTDCIAAAGISPGLKKLIGEIRLVDRAGHRSLSVRDFLVGVTGIHSPDEAALDRRGPVELASTSAGVGSIANEGRAALEFEGIFANRRTLFRVPQHIKARYVEGADSVTLYYDAGDALQVGEALPLVNIPVFRTINHVLVMNDKLLFFWGDNSGSQPDRCYVPE
jgi:hypothetical protein